MDNQVGDSHDVMSDDRFRQQLLELVTNQTNSSSRMEAGSELNSCRLDEIARILCMIANQSHKQSLQISTIGDAVSSLLELYRSVHPDAALHLEKFERLRAEVEKCCHTEHTPDLICHYEPCTPHGGIRNGDGYSAKSTGFVTPLQISEGEHEPWTLHVGTLNDNEDLPQVQQGPIVGQLVPVAATPHVLDFRSGGSPTPGGQAPVTFRTFTESGVTTGVWPPDMSGAKGGDVVVMSGNLWLKLSVDGGKTFTNLDFTKVFAADNIYGGWAGDQVIHYVPQIDCFVLYVQSNLGVKGTPNASKSVVKIALASPADLKNFKGGKAAWRRQWNFTSDTFGLNAWLDFPDISYGDAFLYVNTNAFTRTYDSAGKSQDAFQGKLFFELPLNELKAGKAYSFYYGLCTDSLTYGSPTQNIGDENYWAAHINNSAMRIYSSKGSDPNFYWRERNLKANWPLAPLDKNNNRSIISAAPDSSDWMSEDHRIIGATKVGTLLWFAWSAANGQGGAGGFSFPQGHIQIAKFDISQDFKFIEQTQVWNPDIAFAYPSLTTNSNLEVGISLAWGGGKSYGSHAVGILGDFVVWFGEASVRTSARTSPTRFGDYLHVRLAHPDTRFFSAFGYAVVSDASTPPQEKDDYIYVEFGREAVAPSPLR